MYVLFLSLQAVMQAFEKAVVFVLAISLWSGISAKIAPLPEESMNVVSIVFLILMFLLKMAASTVHCTMLTFARNPYDRVLSKQRLKA